jgi:hypothetical protein
MGNFLFRDCDQSQQMSSKQKELSERRTELVANIKRELSLVDLIPVFDDWFTHYRPRTSLNADEFDDLFSPLLNSTEVFWQVIFDQFQADFYIAMTALVIFSRGNTESKVSFLFQMFNDDGSPDMDRKELARFFTVTIIGLCKICGLPSPS